MEMDGPRAMPLTAAYAFAADNGVAEAAEAIRTMEVEWDLSYTSTVRRGFILELFEQNGLLQSFMQNHWPLGLTAEGQRKRSFYTRIKLRYDEFLAGQEPGPEEEPELEGQEQQFLAESDLRNVLAGNLEVVEPGLKLFERDGRSGMEFSIDQGRIDILAVDKEGRPVVVELKLKRGRNRALGQLLYYMGWVDENIGMGPCRGIILAKEIPEELVLAAKRVPGVSLRRYTLAISTELVA